MGLSSSRFRVFALTLSALRLLNSRAHSKTLIKPMCFHQFHKHAFATSSDVFTWFCEVHKCMLEAGSRPNSKNNYKTNAFVIIFTKTPPQHQTICLHNVCYFQDACSKGVIVGVWGPLAVHTTPLGHDFYPWFAPKCPNETPTVHVTLLSQNHGALKPTKANATNKSKRISQDLSALIPGPAECAKRLK